MAVYTRDFTESDIVAKDINAVAIGSEATVVAATSGKRYRLLGGVLFASAAVSVQLLDNNGSNTVGLARLAFPAANTVVSFSIPGDGMRLRAVGNVITALASGAANLSGTLYVKAESTN